MRLLPLAALAAMMLLAGCAGSDDPATAANTEADEATPLGPVLALASATLGEARVKLGAPVHVQAEVRNSGDREGSFALQLLVDGVVRDEKTFTLFPGARETIVFDWSPPAKGVYALSLAASPVAGGRIDFAPPTQQVTVVAAADIRVTDVTVSSREAPVNTPIAIRAVLANRGDEAGTKEVRLFVNGQVHGTRSVQVGGGLTGVAEFTFTSAARKQPFAIRVEDHDAGSVTFYLPATFELMGLDLDTTRPQLEQAVGGRVEVRNVGDKEGSVDLKLLLAGVPVRDGPEFVGAQSSKVVPFTLQANWVGARTLQVALGGVVKRDVTLTPLAPRYEVTFTESPNNSGFSCYDEAFTSIAVRNAGEGRDFDVQAEFFVDGQRVTVTANGQSGTSWSVAGTLDALASRSSPRFKLTPVEDNCGADDAHQLQVKVRGRYGAYDGEVVTFYV